MSSVRNRWVSGICALFVLAAGAAAFGDGMVVPVRPEHQVRGHWSVKYHHVDMVVRDQVASVSINQEFVATGGQTVEVEYLFPVPPDAAIDSLTLMVNGKEFAAKLMKADEARRVYEEIVRQKKDPALLEYAGFGLYKTRAFPLEPGKPAKVVVTYKDVCKKDADLVRVWYPLNTEKFSAQPLEDVRVRVDVKTDADVTAVYSPSHDLTVERKGPRHVIATYQAKNTLPTTDFQMFYKAADEAIGATLLTHQVSPNEDGHFLLMVSPNPRNKADRITPKDVIVVLDHSGSMSGEKIAQARNSVRFILDHLNAHDRFNVVAYNTEVEPFFDSLQAATPDNVKTAHDMLDRVVARGGTYIDGALTASLNMFDDRRRPAYLLFMTDGQPTIGETEESKILALASGANEGNARVFAFGVGYDVNVRLLDNLVRAHHGRSDYVKPNEPVDQKIAALYRKIKNPVMTNLDVRIAGLKLRNVHPRTPGDLFEGDQILMTGQYDHRDASELPGSPEGRQATLVVTGHYMGRQQVFEYPVVIRRPGKDLRYGFVEELWAVRQVGFLLDQIQLHGETKELIDEIVRLAKAHGIITPYTSFLADERTNLADRDELREKAAKAAEDLSSEVQGGEGQVHAKNRGLLNQAERAPQADAPGGGKKMLGWGDVADYEADQEHKVESVRQIGQTTLYRRDGQWIAANASDVDLKKDADKIQTIERFSEEYFKLIDANTADENQVLASQREGEELILTLRGQTYRVR